MLGINYQPNSCFAYPPRAITTIKSSDLTRYIFSGRGEHGQGDGNSTSRFFCILQHGLILAIKDPPLDFLVDHKDGFSLYFPLD